VARGDKKTHVISMALISVTCGGIEKNLRRK
jgi:hypothetical protein